MLETNEPHPHLTPGFAMMLVPKHRGKSWAGERPEGGFKPRHCACCVDSGLHVTRDR